MEKILLSILLVCISVVCPTHAKDLCLRGEFEHQAATVLKYVRVSSERLRNFAQAASDVERVLQPRWPGCKVMAYGSTVTGLALKSSDIDCYVDIPNKQEDPQTLMTEALDILKDYPNLFQHFKLTLTASVPVLTCVHVPTSVFVDLTFSGPFAVNSSLVLSHLLHLDQRALDLATIIKYWGSVHDIANGKFTLPSYAMVLMTVFYLQQKNILPSVATLQDNVTPYELDYWNTAYQPIEEYSTDNNETLYELLGGFFKYYSDFDFENTVISPYIGLPIKRKHLENMIIDNFSIYKRNLENKLARPFRFGHLNIQDTFKHSENTARPSSEEWLAIRLIKHLRVSARMFDLLSKEELLTALLVPEKRIEAGVLKTFWSGGIGDPEYCLFQKQR